ncbi:glycine/D-amino acid oxidase-like deaminating enzyme [Tenacibaculum skagerrakense]|uniref:Glycine/D-amino acid oxidase-like deaminating enzyme n=1 Tax=Tenacibaculum skagerrakense TaxID=186571 RepID=A0A4R2P293_9FLAO|nr:FAD-dependent oxidoreductase [Tenacibaculum skagerrakense]TCP27991.1 glycine/D-amino acid oxidase-like deaminating enzyme [Tenacibaculum skagerrakense]
MNQLSYWEIKQWFQQVDFTIVGSGIVGLNCALNLQRKYPNAKVLVLEKGMLPQGASTKNAGFACFGSLSELIDDLKSHSEEEVVNLVQRRWEGLQFLSQNLGDKNIDFQQNNGYELFDDSQLYEECLSRKEEINKLLDPIFKKDVFSESENIFQFENIQGNYIVNNFEGQIDTGKMMFHLVKKCQEVGVSILNNTSVLNFEDVENGVIVETKDVTFTTNKLLIATNGFSKQLISEEVKPARAQVLITKPIKNLHIKGTFHLDKGYYYFRNIDNRILFGGGRNLDFKAEETTEFSLTELVQNKLEELLSTTILPNTDFEIEHRWSGIMGVGNQKKSIVKPISNNVYCGVRLGGMGVAIGSLVGKELAELV